jgi:hypothetical protein
MSKVPFNNKWSTLTTEELDRILDSVFWDVFWKKRLNVPEKSND